MVGEPHDAGTRMAIEADGAARDRRGVGRAENGFAGRLTPKQSAALKRGGAAR
jgi:hypothetical protein